MRVCPIIRRQVLCSFLVDATTARRYIDEDRATRSTMLTAAFRASVTATSAAKIVGRRPISVNYFRWFTVDSDTDSVEEETITPSFVLREPTTTTTPPYSQKVLDELPITFADISRAEVAIRGGVKRTTCEKSHFISELVGANVYFKNEFRQFTGSFKERGARNAILKLMREKGSSLRGVIAASAGNHALALAYHGKELGVPVTVVMPTVAPLAKVDKCRVSRYIYREREEEVVSIWPQTYL